MNIHRAKVILEQLSNGIDPIHEKTLPPDHVCNQGEVVRALYCILDELNGVEPRSKRESPLNAGKPWSTDDDDLLAEMYTNGTSVTELSLYFKRSERAITSRLSHQNLQIPPVTKTKQQNIDTYENVFQRHEKDTSLY